MNKRYTFKLVLSGIGETVEQASEDAITGFILDTGELDVTEVEHLDENYEVCKHEDPTYDRIQSDGSHCWRPIKCTKCGKKWNEVYIYSFDEDVKN